MLGLTEDQAVAATGISGSSHFTLGGVVAGFLTNMKNTADPMAVEAGVRACMLASTGYSGPAEVYEGKEGLFQVINAVKWDTDAMLSGLGREFLITNCGYKAFPTEALTHQPITATLEIRNNNNIGPKDVKEILVKTTTRGADILSDKSKYKPTTKETADHSLPYCIAVAVVKGNVLPSDFEEEALKDPLVWEILPKIKVEADPKIDALFPKIKRTRVTITLNNGQIFTKQEDHAKGRTENPLSDEELIAKFKANAHLQLSEERMEKVIDATMNLENWDVGEYMKLLVSDK